MRILTYIKSSPRTGLLYKKHDYICISAFSNASYARKRGARKLPIGFLTFVGGNLVTWGNKNQDISLNRAPRQSIELWLTYMRATTVKQGTKFDFFE